MLPDAMKMDQEVILVICRRTENTGTAMPRQYSGFGQITSVIATSNGTVERSHHCLGCLVSADLVVSQTSLHS